MAGLSAATDQTVYSIVCPVLFGAFLLRTGKEGIYVPNASTLQFLLTLAKGIASQFGPNCEVVVHDLATNDPERSIVAIENGHVTGRKVGDGPSQIGRAHV